jgi:hypothetical protein
MRRNATGHGHFATFGIISTRGGAGFGGGEFIFERENAFGLKLLELGLALFH